jgi:hypothetical protein
MKKPMIRVLSKERRDDDIEIHATSWDGKEDIIVYTPLFPTKQVREETENYLLGELDDHDAYDEYIKELERYEKEVSNEENIQ